MTDKPQLPPLRLSEIEARAQACKEWTAQLRAVGMPVSDWPNGDEWARLAEDDISWADAAHIASMSPDVALRMVKALRAADALRFHLDMEHPDPLDDESETLLGALRAALSEIEE